MTDWIFILIYFGGCSAMRGKKRSWTDTFIWPFYVGRALVNRYIKWEFD